jgi:hypothetical protein
MEGLENIRLDWKGSLETKTQSYMSVELVTKKKVSKRWLQIDTEGKLQLCMELVFEKVTLAILKANLFFSLWKNYSI